MIIRANGGKHKNAEEIKVDFNESTTLKQVLKLGCKKFGNKDDYHRAKIYNKDGV